MRNSILVFNLFTKQNRTFVYHGLSATLLVFFLFACDVKEKESKARQVEEPKIKPAEGFVYLENDSFKVSGSTFFPKLMNYSVCPRIIGNELVISPSIEYDLPNAFDSKSVEASKDRMRAHMKAIKKMGFNSIRLVGMSNVKYDTTNALMTIETFTETKREGFTINPETTPVIVKALKEALSVMEEEALKVMIILPRPRKDSSYTAQKDRYVKAILEEFSDLNTVFSYDYFNEPLYFDNYEQADWKDVVRDKESALTLVRKWKSQMEQHAPHQLLTIGLAEPIEVFEWDPEILPIDFVSFHTYHPLRVPNEIYWYAKYVNKPWIISETSLPADNDSISYRDQAVFMKEMLQRVINCGGQGIGWWQYQDVRWGPFEHNFTPLISLGEQTDIDSSTYIMGQFKDAAFLLPKLPMFKTGECDCHINYYNMMGYHNYKIRGTVLDQNNRPIEGAVIRGWNQYWTIGMNTFTNKYGDFNLYSNDECVKFEISAPGYTKVKFEKKLNYKPNPKKLRLENVDLEYHQNHFQWYLDSTYAGSSVFKFDENLFSNYKTRSSLGVIKLEKLSL